MGQIWPVEPCNLAQEAPHGCMMERTPQWARSGVTRKIVAPGLQSHLGEGSRVPGNGGCLLCYSLRGSALHHSSHCSPVHRRHFTGQYRVSSGEKIPTCLLHSLECLREQGHRELTGWVAKIHISVIIWALCTPIVKSPLIYPVLQLKCT